MKIVVVMTYYDRQYQLTKTLDSLVKSNHPDFEVVVVDDASPVDIILKDYPFDVSVIKVKNKTWTNGVPAFNMGFAFALLRKPDVIIIQNAECYHHGDVISYASDNIRSDNYLTFGCYSLNQKLTFLDHNIHEIVKADNHIFLGDGKLGWYNHSTLRPAGYHWCSAISAENLVKLNGFDERFSYGYAYEDNYFLYQVKRLGLNVLFADYPFVVHQWHSGMTGIMKENRRLWRRNKNLYNILSRVSTYKAEHRITKDFI